MPGVGCSWSGRSGAGGWIGVGNAGAGYLECDQCVEILCRVAGCAIYVKQT
jgi:hypothetical protein